MPELTIKALAEFALKPVSDQMRILAEQKRPAAGAAPFKMHYYQATRMAIRQFYKSGNNRTVLQNAIKKIRAGGGQDHKKNHNERAVRSFSGETEYTDRALQVARAHTAKTSHAGVDLRFHPDILATEGTKTKFILVNYTQAPIDEELARITLELMYWMLRKSGEKLAIRDCEIFDLASKKTIVESRKPRKGTLKNAENNLRVIAHLWPII